MRDEKRMVRKYRDDLTIVMSVTTFCRWNFLLIISNLAFFSVVHDMNYSAYIRRITVERA